MTKRSELRYLLLASFFLLSLGALALYILARALPQRMALEYRVEVLISALIIILYPLVASWLFVNIYRLGKRNVPKGYLTWKNLEFTMVYKVLSQSDEYGYTVLQTSEGEVLAFETLVSEEYPLQNGKWYRPVKDPGSRRVRLQEIA